MRSLFIVLTTAILLNPGCDSAPGPLIPSELNNESDSPETQAPSDSSRIEGSEFILQKASIPDQIEFVDEALSTDAGFSVSVGYGHVFEHIYGQSLTFSTWSDSPALSPQIDGNRLRISAREPTTGTVFVRAMDPAGDSNTLSFRTTFRSHCALPVPAGHDDYFPLEPGMTRRYDYRSALYATDSRSTEGVLTWTVLGSMDCTRGRETIEVERKFEGRYRLHEFHTGETTTGQVNTRSIMEFVINDSMIVSAPFIESPMRRYYSSSHPDSIRRSGTTLVRGRGMVRYSYFHHAGVNWDEYEDLWIINDEG